MKTVGGDGSEMGSLTKKGKQAWMTSIGASLTPDVRDKEENNNIDIHWRKADTITKHNNINLPDTATPT